MGVASTQFHRNRTMAEGAGNRQELTSRTHQGLNCGSN